MNIISKDIVILFYLMSATILSGQNCVEHRNSLICNDVYIEASYTRPANQLYIEDSLRIRFTIKNERDNSILIFDPAYYLNKNAILTEYSLYYPGFAYDLGEGWSYSLEFAQFIYLKEIESGDEYEFYAEFPKEFLLTRGYTEKQKLRTFIKLGRLEFSFGFGFIEITDKTSFLLDMDLSPIEISATGYNEYFDLHLERMTLWILEKRNRADLYHIK